MPPYLMCTDELSQLDAPMPRESVPGGNVPSFREKEQRGSSPGTCVGEQERDEDQKPGREMIFAIATSRFHRGTASIWAVGASPDPARCSKREEQLSGSREVLNKKF